MNSFKSILFALAVPAALLAADQEIRTNKLAIGDNSEVHIASNETIAQINYEDYVASPATSVPDCVIVGSNSVGVLKVDGRLVAKMAIADGEVAAAKGAVLVNAGAVVTNISSVAAEALLGRSGYASLEVDGSYTAFGSWYGAQAGQLSLNVTGEFIHPDATVRGSSFSLGGADARASLTVDGGVFNASCITSNLVIPRSASVAGVAISVEKSTARFDIGTNALSIADATIVNVNSGATLRVRSVSITSPAKLQMNGGYLAVTKGGEPFIGDVYGYASGFGLEVPSALTAEFSEGSVPLAPTGNGIDSIALGTAVAGRKFIGPPLVKIEDTAGGGGTAVAVLDDNGEVSAIRVTGRGMGYEAPTAKLVYGTDAEIELGAVSISENVAGPLLKRGDGELAVTVKTGLNGVKIFGGTVRVSVDDAFNDGGLYLASGSTLDAGSRSLTFSDYQGKGTIVNGPVTVTDLTLDAARVVANDVDTLNFDQISLTTIAKVTVANPQALDSHVKRYVAYNLAGTIPDTLPEISEAAYAAGLQRGWKLKREGNQLVLNYIGGSLFIIY